MANIVSYNDIIELMRSIAERHYQINTFFLGKDWELENNQDIQYPILQVFPQFASMPINNWKEYKTLELTLNCKVVDLTTPAEENEMDVHSDTLRISQDIVNELNQHPYYIRSNVSLMETINFEAIEEFKDDISAGWKFQLKLRIINANTFCGMPIAELDGISANGPTSSGQYVNVRYLTCETLPDCPVIINIQEAIAGLTGATASPPSLQDVITVNGTINGLLSQSPDTSTYIYMGDGYIDMSSYDGSATSGFNMYASTGNNLYSDTSNSITSPKITLTASGTASMTMNQYNTTFTGNVTVTSNNDNAGISIVSPPGFYYPSLGFYNVGNNFLGSITGYAGQLYIGGVSGTPLIVNSAAINLPLETVNSLLYVDSGSNVKSAHLGVGLSFSGLTLSTTNNKFSYTDASTGITSVSNSNTLSKSVLIPANTLTNGALNIKGRSHKSGTGSFAWLIIYVNTTNSLSGASEIGRINNAGNNTVLRFSIDRTIPIKVGSFFSLIINAIYGYEETITNNVSTVTIDWTVDQYIILAVQANGGASPGESLVANFLSVNQF